ncbi:MAG: DMT family transporter [Clostridia bacterium]
MNKRHLPVLAGIAVAFIFGFSFTVTKSALGSLGPFHMLGLRFMFAALLLWLLRILGLIKIRYSGKSLRTLFFLALFQPVLYFIFETTGIGLTTASESGMMIALIPVVAAILGAVFLKERPGLAQWIFIIISVGGVFFIALMRKTETQGSIAGVAMLLIAVIASGGYNILSRKLSVRFSPMEITFMMMNTGFVVFNGIAVTEHIARGGLSEYFLPLKNPGTFFSMAYLGILSSVAAFFMVNYMLSRLEATKVAVFGNLITVVSIAAGILVLGETLHWFHAIGAVLILIGVWGTNYYGAAARIAGMAIMEEHNGKPG